MVLPPPPPGEVLPWHLFRGKVCYVVFLQGEHLPYGIISGEVFFRGGRSRHESQRNASGGKGHLIRGEGSAARIINELRSQDPGGGVKLTAFWAKMHALPVDTYGRGSGCKDLVSFSPATGVC